MNIFFEFMSMILNNHMFKINLSKIFKTINKIFILQVVQKKKIGFK
jgi:hypothetical protein